MFGYPGEDEPTLADKVSLAVTRWDEAVEAVKAVGNFEEGSWPWVEAIRAAFVAVDEADSWAREIGY